MRLDHRIIESDVEQAIGDAAKKLLTRTFRYSEDTLMLSAQRDQIDHLQVTALYQSPSELATLRERDEAESFLQFLVGLQGLTDLGQFVV